MWGTFGIKIFRIDDGGVDVGEDFEMCADADVIAVAGDAVADFAGAFGGLFEGDDRYVRLYLFIAEDTHLI